MISRRFLVGLLFIPFGVLCARVHTAAQSATVSSRSFESKLNAEDSILHAVDRLTFGPRPGDVDRIRKLTLKKWLDLQLHPERIPENPDLERKLAPLESLRMTAAETARSYPQPQMIKAIAEGRQPLPEDPLLRASLQQLVARYRAKVKAPSEPESIPAEAEPERRLKDVLQSDQARILRSGSPAEKHTLLTGLAPDRLEKALIAMPRPMRQSLFNDASPDVKRKILMLNRPQQVVAYDLLQSKLLRAAYSNRQLAEELDDFWFNHFNVYYDKGADRFLIPSYERDAIRPHVLGRFRDLLEATAKSPAMLFYLDNFQSVRPDFDAGGRARKTRRGLNENYARELMELHTLGVNGGYTQKDVIEVARCFTGWGIEAPRRGGGFRYNDQVHDKGEKVVLGHVIPAGGGMEDGERVLDILAENPATARFISLKLAQRFVADDPPTQLLDSMARTFLRKRGDIREVIRTMLSSRQFWSAGAYRAKIKTPLEMVVSGVRALDANVEDAFALANQVGQLGEPLYRKQEPTGYSNLNGEWVNSAALLGRMNFGLALAANKVAGVTVDAKRFMPAGGLCDPDALAQTLANRRLTPQTRASIESALRDGSGSGKAAVPQNELMTGLILGSPEFQRK